MVLAGTLLAGALRSRPLKRYTAVSAMPEHVFVARRRFKASLMGVDGGAAALQVYHWPLLRRVFFADRLPSGTDRCLRVRPFGVDVVNIDDLPAARGAMLTVEPLWREPDATAVCRVWVSRGLLRREASLAALMVAQGAPVRDERPRSPASDSLKTVRVLAEEMASLTRGEALAEDLRAAAAAKGEEGPGEAARVSLLRRAWRRWVAWRRRRAVKR